MLIKRFSDRRQNRPIAVLGALDAILFECDPGRLNSRTASPEPSLLVRVRGFNSLDRVFGIVDGAGDHTEVN